MHQQNIPIYYVKYRNKESEDKALRELINEDGLAEVNAIEEERVNMRCVTMREKKKLHERKVIPKTTNTKGYI